MQFAQHKIYMATSLNKEICVLLQTKSIIHQLLFTMLSRQIRKLEYKYSQLSLNHRHQLYHDPLKLPRPLQLVQHIAPLYDPEQNDLVICNSSSWEIRSLTPFASCKSFWPFEYINTAFHFISSSTTSLMLTLADILPHICLVTIGTISSLYPW